MLHMHEKEMDYLDKIDDLVLLKDWYANHNNKTLNLIVKKHYKLIFSVMNRYNIPNEDYEDIFAEGVISIMTALENFDIGKNLKLNSLHICIIGSNLQFMVFLEGFVKLILYL